MLAPYMRRWRRNPLLLIHNTITIGFCVGVVTAIVTLTRALAFQPLPVPNASRLVELWSRTGTSTAIEALTGGELIELQQSTGNMFSELGGFTVHEFWLDNAGRPPQRVGTVRLEAAAFGALAMRVTLGRPPIPQQDFGFTGTPPIWISQGFWRTRFGGQPSAIGKTIRLGTDADAGSLKTYTIAGVLPLGAALPHPTFTDRVDLWIPLPAGLAARATDARVFFALGRLRPGVAISLADAELTSIASRRPVVERQHKPVIVALLDILNHASKGTLGLLSVAVIIVFFLALFNVLGLTVAEWERRDSEMMVQVALGASRLRLWRDVVAEHLALTGIAASFGVWVAHTTLPVLARLIPAAGLGPPPETVPDVDLLVITILFLVVVGATASLSALRLNHHLPWQGRITGSKSPERKVSGHSYLSRPISSWPVGLLAIQVATGACLVVISALVTQAYRERSTPHLGPNPALTSIFSVRPARLEELSADEAASFNDELFARLGPLTSTGSVALADYFPPLAATTSFWTASDPAGQPRTATSPSIVSRTYFDLLGIAVLRGRGFDANDRKGSEPVALINRTLARETWSEPFRALDTVIRVGTRSNVFRVVGIVDDFTGYWQRAAPPMIYLSQSQQPTAGGDVLICSELAAGDVERVRAALAGSSFRINISGGSTLLARWQDSVSRPRARVAGMLLLTVATVALMVQGIYSLGSMIVVSRRREMAIRLALGGSRLAVAWQILRRVVVASAFGLAVGMVAGMTVSPLVQSWTGDTVAHQTAAIIVAAAGITAITLAACAVPCVVVSNMRPLQQLREI